MNEAERTIKQQTTTIERAIRRQTNVIIAVTAALVVICFCVGKWV